MAKQERANAVVRNHDQIQSYIMTTAKYDFSVSEKRIIYRLVEMAQTEVQGLKFPNDCRKIEHDLFGRTKITMLISDILNGEEDHNHAQAKKALMSLQKKTFQYEDDEVWKSISIISYPEIIKRAETFTFEVAPEIWNCILDFSKGYRKYELVTAMRFKSVYSMRFYEIMSGQTSKLTFSISQLREMFGLQGKYNRINDLQRYVLDFAKKELDEYSPYSFEYKLQKTGRKFSHIDFIPKYIPKNRDPEIERKELKQKVSLSWSLPPEITQYLQHSMSFTSKELKANRDTLIQAAQTLPDLIGTLAILKGKSRDKANPKGWIISSLKGKIHDSRKV